MVNNYKLILSYNGHTYFGWQKTKSGPSIEESLEKALFSLLKHHAILQAASRTDRGVHAKGQVINFFSKHELNPKATLRSLNALLPPEIAALSLEKVHHDFHPSLDSKGKEYCYYITPHSSHDPIDYPYSWHLPYPLDIDVMKEAAAIFLGTHDFSSLTKTRFPSHKDTVCTLSTITLSHLSLNRLKISITGDRFLYRMARNLVGTLVDTARGKLSCKDVKNLLEKKSRREAGMTAPACGLFLRQVFYNSRPLVNNILNLS